MATETGLQPEQQPFLDLEKDHYDKPIQSRLTIWHLLITAVVTAIVCIAGILGIQDHLAEPLRLPGLAVPLLGTTARTFMFEDIYVAKPNATTKEAWAALVPQGRGFLAFPAAVQSSNAISSTSDNDQYSIAVFHQLHCLSFINTAYHLALDEREHDVQHVFHCFEYLRNSILCAADTALEPWKEDIHGVDGFGTKHMCRDIDAVRKWAEQWRVNDQDGV